MKTTMSTLAFVIASILCVFSEPLPFDPTPVEDPAQDGAGRVWAIGEELGLLRWNGDKWEWDEPRRRLAKPRSGGRVGWKERGSRHA